MSTPLRFGASISNIQDGAAWRVRAPQVERLGYDAILTGDFPLLPAPVAMLAMAAGLTDSIRLGVYVLNPMLRDPHVVVHELATLDRLSGGRLDVGLGLGLGRVSSNVVVRGAVDARGDESLVEQRPVTGRVDRLNDLLDELERAFAGDVEHAHFVQVRPPILIGGAGPRLMEAAATRADRFVLSGPRTKGVYPALTDFDETAHAFAEFRALAGARAGEIELGINLQFVVVTADREAAAAEIQQLQKHLSVEGILESPRAAIGTHEEIAAHLARVHAAMGVSWFNVLGPNLEDFAPVIELLR